MSDNPVLIQHPGAALSHVKAGGSIFVGGIWGTVNAGQSVVAADGLRFIWAADSFKVVFYQNGKFFSQSAKGLASEIKTAPLVVAGRRAAPIARLSEAEMKLLSGIFAGSSGLGFAIVVGTEVGGFVLENRRNFDRWQKSLEGVLKARQFLRQHAPTLYDKVFDAILNRVFSDVKTKLPQSITMDTVAFGVGVVFGSVGKKAATDKFSLLAVIFAVVEQLAVRFALSAVPEAIRLTAVDYQRLASDIIEKIRQSGLVLQQGDVEKIIDEAQKHPGEIKRAYEMLRDAFGQFGKT